MPGEWIHSEDFLPFFQRDRIFVTSCCLSYKSGPFKKVILSKSKDFIPEEQTFSLLRRPYRQRRMGQWSFVTELSNLQVYPPQVQQQYNRVIKRRSFT